MHLRLRGARPRNAEAITGHEAGHRTPRVRGRASGRSSDRTPGRTGSRRRRAQVTGRFDGLEQPLRTRLLAEQREHDLQFTAFTEDGTDVKIKRPHPQGRRDQHHVHEE
ncbi:DUF6204 family protein [Streptomyces sp. NPDC056237]|uniref:DUF6204 family protein n=1 Tax=unclassified Streptomyces TaxID=2593676 RepID=UPI0035E05256